MSSCWPFPLQLGLDTLCGLACSHSFFDVLVSFLGFVSPSNLQKNSEASFSLIHFIVTLCGILLRERTFLDASCVGQFVGRFCSSVEAPCRDSGIYWGEIIVAAWQETKELFKHCVRTLFDFPSLIWRDSVFGRRLQTLTGFWVLNGLCDYHNHCHLIFDLLCEWDNNLLKTNLWISQDVVMWIWLRCSCKFYMGPMHCTRF